MLYLKWWLEFIFRHYSKGQKTSGLSALIDDILWELESAFWDIIELLE